MDDHRASLPAAVDTRPPLVGLSKAQLVDAVAALGEKRFRADQLWHWIYVRGAKSFEDMTDLSKKFRAKLADHHTVGRPVERRAQISVDGTRKWLFRFGGRHDAETVFIPDEDRGTLCISSQVGCTLTCKFCHTGTQRLVRNLEPGEIVGQVMAAKDAFSEWPTPIDGSRTLTNIVLMGMGEPLYNYENVRDAMKIVMADDGIGIGKRRITLSTSGVVPMIERAGKEIEVNLAISLHAANDDVRSEIMPINKKYPLKELMHACRTYPGASNARRITFEYVMLKGINDSDADARALAKLVKGLPAKFNLIPFNPWPGSQYECSDERTIERFSYLMAELGYTAPIRTPRGQDILAACGQLKSDTEKLSARELRAKQKEAAAS